MARIIRTDEARLLSIAEHRASPILEVVMLDAADALPLAKRAEPSWRRAVERSVQDHCDVSDKLEAHSLGGNIVRSYLVHVTARYGHKALSRIRLVVTLGTPYEGADLANLSRLCFGFYAFPIAIALLVAS